MAMWDYFVGYYLAERIFDNKIAGENVVLYGTKMYNNINDVITSRLQRCEDSVLFGQREEWIGRNESIMSDKVYTIEELRKMLSPVFKNHDVRRAILFGSYGKGNATKKSDIDLLVDSNLKGLRFVGLIEDLRSTVDKEMDVFDVTHVEQGSLMDTEIKETGILLYEE